MSLPIYLDYAATTPVDARVAETMIACLTMDGVFANPASRSHVYGWQAEEKVEDARNYVAELIGAEARDIVWTSGATEANNLAIKGYAYQNRDKGNHIITSAYEHKAVLDCCKFLEQHGFEVTYLQPDPAGLISAAQVESALRSTTILVTIMHVNNELGTRNDIVSLGKACRLAGVCFHTDAAQSVGKLIINLDQLPVDMLSISAHKFYGPKGMGALFVRRNSGIKLEAQIHGGGHERGMRSGTLPTHQIAGMGEAARLAAEKLPGEADRINRLRLDLWGGLQQIGGVHLHGDPDQRVAGILNVGFDGVDGETLLMALNSVAVSTGSACTSASMEPSFVLRAIGVSTDLADASIRFSVGRYTSSEDIQRAVAHVQKTVSSLRS